ncbi:AAA family ATPase [Gordonia alkaliphila]|uniref:AAA family ATPase n=1 Tax=Gordonia alkaliphila TaxID=1053547 RepID=UPI001FF4274E|nr:AAA family ATPase [Gordonia alkaliphila]MCK0440110.1 AAA family ATPase [Gordonia alkaliphila]
MRLHRLRLKDFRGIAEREVEFAASGVTVVEGANEAGKSSMIEALDLLLQTQASSKSAAVKAVQPAGRDVGSEVLAEISCGAWRFEYFKRFNKRAETALTITEPRREQLTGREAHERVEQILGQSMDDSLYKALRLMQSGAPDLGQLTDSSALAKALDRAAGPTPDDDAEDDGDSGALIAAAGKEYRRYFTEKSGKPAAELAAARAAAAAARGDVDERLALLRNAEQATAQLPDVERAYRQATDNEVHATVESANCSQRVAEAEKVAAVVDQARERAERRAIAVDVAERDVRDRAAAETRLAELDRQQLADQALLDEARATAAAADARAQTADAQARALHTELTAAQAELVAAQRAVQAGADRTRIAAIEAALAEAADLAARRAGHVDAIAGNPVTDTHVAAATQLDREIVAAAARVEAVAATVEVAPTGEVEVLVDGRPVTGAAEFSAVGETVVQAPGVRVVVRGAADTQVLADHLADLRAQAADLVAVCGVDDLSEVAVRAAARSSAQRDLQDVDQARHRVLAGSTEEALADERERLVAGLPEETAEQNLRPTTDLQEAVAELNVRLLRSQQQVSAERAAASDARARMDVLAAGLERDAAGARQQRATLLEKRAQHSDEALRGALVSAQDAHTEALAAVDAARAAADHLDLAGLQNAAAEAQQRLDRIVGDVARLRDQRTQLRTVLEMCRTENRLDDLAEAEATAKAAENELARVTERAEGARLLYTSLQRTRSESRSRYVAPFTRRLEELAAPVFGDSVRFEVREDFTVATRTLDGVTVPVDALSGGAREQLGLIARLACALIVDEDDGVPVILDDTLGYTDPERLTSMAQVLGAAAGAAQIIVLTCTPKRYADVGQATVVAV